MSAPSKIHFEISERKILLRVFDLICVFLTLYIVSHLFNFNYFKFRLNNWEWIIVLCVYLSLFGTIFELYDLRQASKFDIVFKNILLTASATVILYLLTPFYTPALPYNRLQIVYFFIAIVVALTLWRLAYISLISSPRFYKRILLIGNTSDALSLSEALEKSDPNFKIIGCINTGNSYDEMVELSEIEIFSATDIKEIVTQHSISEIVVSDRLNKSISMRLYAQLLKLVEEGHVVKDFTQVYEEITYKVPVDHIDKDFYKYFPFSRSHQNRLYRVIHHGVDYCLSIVGLILGFALLPGVLLGNALANRGPLFYTQVRVGKNGELFNILKLRTMIVNAETNGAVWAQNNDQRITRFGKFLRKTRIDELPQVVNVLCGDMSIIGPRPERPEFVKQLAEQIPFYEVRHVIRPGLTGWAQVKGRYASSEQDALEKLQYDLYYIKKRSLYLDINILLKTLSTVVFYRGH
jgi:exopolysaccharide biosynthesis polyprenyl glycosylphosphotransferase